MFPALYECYVYVDITTDKISMLSTESNIRQSVVVLQKLYQTSEIAFFQMADFLKHVIQ